jgi:hypothetical protein
MMYQGPSTTFQLGVYAEGPLPELQRARYCHFVDVISVKMYAEGPHGRWQQLANWYLH